MKAKRLYQMVDTGEPVLEAAIGEAMVRFEPGDIHEGLPKCLHPFIGQWLAKERVEAILAEAGESFPEC